MNWQANSLGTARTIGNRELREGRSQDARDGRPPTAAAPGRPLRRGDCADVPRPCPYVSCRYNLFLEAKANGAIKLNQGDDVTAMLDGYASCALDVAADGPLSMDRVAQLLNLTRARLEQIEAAAMKRLGVAMRELQLDPGALEMTEETYEQAPINEALDQLGLGDDKQWLNKICNQAEVAQDGIWAL